MGSTESDLDRLMAEEYCNTCYRPTFEDELPQHSVYLDAFWIDQTEVTNQMFTQFLNDLKIKPNAKQPYAYGDKVGGILFNNGLWEPAINQASKPVRKASWYAADAYCRWAGRRVPTEAEWEKAARGEDGRLYPWGNEIDCSYAYFNGCEGNSPREVGTYLKGASPYGALDMASSAEEWVNDYYDETYYDHSPDQNPPGPTSGYRKVERGGHFSFNPDGLRTAARTGEDLDPDKTFGAGFRCALTAIAKFIPFKRALFLNSPHLKGNDVIQLQQRLLELGYITGGADGDFGEKTDLAVRQFQEKNGLEEDGVVGSITWDLLFSEEALEH